MIIGVPKEIKNNESRVSIIPFGVEELINFGVGAIIQPGGSIRDKEIISTANKFGIAMILTGTRHFRH